jgi:hypothetical protein
MISASQGGEKIMICKRTDGWICFGAWMLFGASGGGEGAALASDSVRIVVVEGGDCWCQPAFDDPVVVEAGCFEREVVRYRALELLATWLERHRVISGGDCQRALSRSPCGEVLCRD